MIEVKHITKKYGDKVAVDDLSFSLSECAVHGFLGPNGAGKTTTMNILTGCISATSGSVVINGIDLAEDPIAAKKKIGYLPDIPPLYDNMTPYEYLVFIGEAKKVPYEKLYKNVKSVIELVGIEEVSEKLIKNLSKGYRQRVGIAQTMLGNPDVIVLDEPMTGLDPRQMAEMRELLKKLGQIKTIIISSHVLSEISEICDDIIIISHGKMIAHDTIENLERKLNKTQALCISVRGSEERVLSALEGVDGLSDCTVSENSDGVISLKLEHDSKTDVRDAVFAALAGVSCPILSMDIESLTLEDIFLKLTDIGEDKSVSEEPKKKKIFERRRKAE